jgi:hypothetical protein
MADSSLGKISSLVLPERMTSLGTVVEGSTLTDELA